MPVSAPLGGVEAASAPSDEGNHMPAAKAAPGPPAATCPECGVTVRFMRGYDPTPISWDGGICPACRRLRIMQMDEEEQRRVLVAEIHRDPAAPATALAQRTGLGPGLARRVRREAVKQGIALALNWNGTPTPERKPSRKAKVDASVEQVKSAVTTRPGSGAGDVADKLAIPRTTARRHLKALVDAGEVRTTKQGRSVHYFPAASG